MDVNQSLGGRQLQLQGEGEGEGEGELQPLINLTQRRKQITRTVLSPVLSFADFLHKGNFLPLAVAFLVGAAFQTAVRSFVDDILFPPIGLLIGGSTWNNLFAVLKVGKSGNANYTTLQAAIDDGAVTENFGKFFLSMFNLMVIAVVMFFVVKLAHNIAAQYKKMKAELTSAAQAEEKECPFCCQMIPKRAKRCGFCTSQLPDVLPSSPPAEDEDDLQ